MSNWWPECLQWPFCPGFFITVLAFMAGAVTCRKEPGPREKSTWGFAFLMLMVGEVWMMSKDRTENSRKQKEVRDAEIASFKPLETASNLPFLSANYNSPQQCPA